MPEYLIAFNDEWVPDYTDEEMAERSKAVQALRAEMKAAGVYVFLGGLDNSAPAFSVDASSGSPVFTDGPYAETKEHLGGFTIVDVADEEAARMWSGKAAAACGWPQEVRRFQVPRWRPENRARVAGRSSRVRSFARTSRSATYMPMRACSTSQWRRSTK